MEAAIWLAVGLVGFYSFHGSWLLFAFCFLIPDLGLLGYFVNSRVGGLTYNLMHTEIGPLFFAGLGYFMGPPIFLHLALIWFCHINFDRMLAIGLKIKDQFDETHLGISPFAKK